MKCSFGISDFLEEISSLSQSVVFLYFFALIAKKAFLSLLAILWNFAFRCLYLSFSPLGRLRFPQYAEQGRKKCCALCPLGAVTTLKCRTYGYFVFSFRLFATPWSMQPLGGYSPWNSPGQNTGGGSLSLLQGIFPTQGSNPDLPHCRQILYQLNY